MLDQYQALAAGFELAAPPIAGGQSLVYKALHSATGNAVALKVFNSHVDQQQILREAASLAAIKHNNIATFIAAGYIGKQPYVATQWIDGVRLCDYEIDSRPLGNECAWQIIKRIGSALCTLHDRKIVHGDLSPANIIIKPDGTPVLIDFGLGVHTADQTTVTGTVLGGTPRYIAPEIILGEAANTASDQYTLAIIFYELLSGCWPFANVNDPMQLNAARALHHQLYTAPVLLSELDPTFDSRLDNLFSTALHKQPGNRYADVHSLLGELASVNGLNSTEGFSGSAATTKRKRVVHTNINDRKIAILTTCLTLSLATAATVWAFQFDSDNTVTARMSSSKNAAVAPAEAKTSDNLSDKPSDNLCNLMPNSEFDHPLSDNFYRDANNPEVVVIINDKQISTSPVLQVGNTGEYGLYGQIIPIDSNNQYQFKASVFLDGHVEKAELVVEWLDSAWQQMPDAGIRMSITDYGYNDIATLNIKPPESAHYAVPTVFKNASTGEVKVDNLVFSVIGERC